MSSSHSDKYLTKLLFGLSAVITSIFVIVFACFERTKKEDWYFWGLVASILMCTGLLLLLSSVVHKIKSDLINRQKSREMQKTKEN
ncbi:MAG: hypothetical protein IPQ06_10000 [Chitinophagaceae bacterium]|nr:hypothetical protein [Chitinophagaceae bacterium]